MPQYKYILFKDGQPWKGMFSELDFMNEYEHAFKKVLENAEARFGSKKFTKEFAIIKFFKEFQPVKWDSHKGGYLSLFRDYIIGANENEGSIVYGIDWEDMSLKERTLFEFLDKDFKCLLTNLNKAKKWDRPVYGVTRGTGALSTL